MPLTSGTILIAGQIIQLASPDDYLAGEHELAKNCAVSARGGVADDYVEVLKRIWH